MLICPSFRCLSIPRARVRRRAGFTLIDVMMAATVLAVAISAVAGSIVVSMSMNRVNRDTAIAQEAARRVMEELASRPFNEVFAAYNSDAGDDAGLLSPAVGPSFAVPGLEPSRTDPDGLCGRVMFPTQVVGGIEELREDVVDPMLGMPRELDGVGGIDALDHRANYRLLPVRVRVEWQGSIGPRRVDVETMLCQR